MRKIRRNIITIGQVRRKMELPVNYNNLTFAERRQVREKYTELQDGKCFFCKHDLNEEAPEHIKEKKINWSRFPDNFLKYPVHLQHCHKSNMTEGTVHNYCNAVMWQYHGR